MVIHHRAPELLRECLGHLRRHAPWAHVSVVDTDAHAPWAQLDWIGREFPGVCVRRSDGHSFSRAVNDALKASTRPFVCHLNADVMVGAETLEALLTAAQAPAVAMVGPRCRTPSGKWQAQGLGYGRYYRRLERGAVSTPVPWLSGCMQLVKREAVLAVGGMDETLRFYNEDMEWCWRLRRAGYRCLLARAEVLHIGGSSTPRDPRFLVEGYRGGYVLSQRYCTRPYQLLHYLVVRGEAAFRARFDRDPIRREAYRRIHGLFAKQAFDESPFKTSLSEGG